MLLSDDYLRDVLKRDFFFIQFVLGIWSEGCCNRSVFQYDQDRHGASRRDGHILIRRRQLICL